MQKNKTLSIDELEKVSGGSSAERYYNYEVRYKNTATGKEEKHALGGTYYQSSGRKQAIAEAQQWCAENGVEYVGLHQLVE